MPAERSVASWRARLAARVFVPLLLVLLAWLEARGGPGTLPRWLATVGARFDLSEDLLLRVLIALQLGLAGIALLIPRWSRTVSTTALVLLVFAAVAEVSALVGAGGEALAFVPPLIILAASASLLPTTLRAVGAASSAGSPAWRVLGSLAIGVASVAIATRIPFGEAASSPATAPASGVEVVELALEDWTGRSLPETGLTLRLPELAALTLEGRSVLVLHDPRCGQCHDLFATWFAAPVDARVIAVRVPPAPGSPLLESDQPEEVACADCVRLSLPEGPTWLVQTPAVVVVEEGEVRCVAKGLDEAGECLASWIPSAPDAASP